ncbi:MULTISPECIES: GGDEF domain-containing protein [Phyllobacteriaceae]|nr:GGDEF domain-containing protein [Mesorhizobium sp. RMAD-H1]MBB2970641.1 diguanylate cyclase (GGDEF)-like protein [Mesorhizobium sp. RMAD-H1]
MEMKLRAGEIAKNVIIWFACILASVELLVYLYYAPMGTERLRSEFIISGLITTVVSLPAIIYGMILRERLTLANAAMQELLQSDRMSGLLNRKVFMERLAMFLKDAERSVGVLAYIDADHFKIINDRFGHRVGDAAIRLIGDCIRHNSRSSDLMGRLAGQEFGVFLEGANLKQAVIIAERLRTQVAQASSGLGIKGLELSVSIGLAVHKPGQSVEVLMSQADRNLGVAKESGRNAVVADLQRYTA